MTQVMASGAAWAPSWIPYLPKVQAESPQAPDYPIFDTVELSLKSIYAGRAGSFSAKENLTERWDLKLNSLHRRGLRTNAGAYAAKKSAVFVGGLSVLKNVASMANGDVNVARATGNVTSDLTTGTISAFVAGGAGAMGVHGFANAGKFVAGTMGTIAGTVGFVAADFLFDKSGLKDYLSDSVTSALEGVGGHSHLPVQL